MWDRAWLSFLTTRVKQLLPQKAKPTSQGLPAGGLGIILGRPSKHQFSPARTPDGPAHANSADGKRRHCWSRRGLPADKQRRATTGRYCTASRNVSSFPRDAQPICRAPTAEGGHATAGLRGEAGLKQRVAGSSPAGRATLNLGPSLDSFSRYFFLCGQLGNIWEQLIFELIDGLSLSACARVRVYLKRSAHVRVAELSLSHFQWRAEFVQQ